MADRIDQQRPANQDQNQGQNQAQSSQNRGLARRDNRSNLTYYGGRAASPFDLMRRFSEDVDRMFASLGFGSFGSMFEPWSASQRGGRMAGTSGMSSMAWAPSVDVTTRGDDLVVMADLPGMKPENVQIEVDENQLIIRGETKGERTQEDKEHGYWYSERNYGSFYRSIPLPQGVNPDNARAAFNDGVLEITFPGAARRMQSQRRIEIQGPKQAQDDQTAQGREDPDQGGQSINQSAGESSQTTR
jgi:HSP20 family protein